MPEPTPSSTPTVSAVLRACLKTRESLDRLADDVARYTVLSGTLIDTSAFVRALGQDVRSFSINGLVASSRLQDAATLDAVAAIQRGRSVALEPVVHALGDDIAATITLLDGMSSRVAAGRTHAATLASFALDHVDDPELSRAAAGRLAVLAAALDEAVDRLCDDLDQLHERLRALDLGALRLDRELRVIHALEVGGPQDPRS
jgi:hypothetical protein